MLSYKKSVIILSTLLFIGGLSACSSDSDPTTSIEYTNLVEDYNSLSKKYNEQTSRNVKNDEVIKKASLELSTLDSYVADFKKNIQTAYDQKEDGLCVSTLNIINEQLRPGMKNIAATANNLSQGTLEAALKSMSEDMSSYKDSSVNSSRQKILSAKRALGPGLRGIKAFSRFSLNRLIDDYNAGCARKAVTKPSPSDEEVIPKNRVVTVDESGKRSIITRDEMKKRYAGTYDEKAYNNFTDLADLSGGFVGFSPTAEMFSNTVDTVLDAILAQAGSRTDVAIVIDTTSSMHDDMDNVKKNMERLIKKLEAQASSIGLKLSVVLYRDRADSYLTKVAQDFTSNTTQINTAIQSIRTGGGGDHPEAVLDALSTTLIKLSWRDNAKRSVVLIGDAPGHKKSHSTRESTETIVQKYKDAGLGMIIYPILVSN